MRTRTMPHLSRKLLAALLPALLAAALAPLALAVDAHDNLFVATSPDGKVYKVSPSGEKSVFFEPKTKYIWDLAVNAGGTVYVATGDKGQIFAVAPDGKGELFYAAEETHIRSLALDSKGNLLAGTEPSGRILRISTAKLPDTKKKGDKDDAASSGHAFVLYETSKKEI